MFKYKILEYGKDFGFLMQINNKGSRSKKNVVNWKNIRRRKGIFKYEKYNCSEVCSEKISYEIAKKLKIKIARIELAKDEEGNLGSISYLFIDKNHTHTDAKDFFNKNENDRKKFYTLSNIKDIFEKYTTDGFDYFIEMMVFDALVGETDRHEENWGLLKNNKGIYRMSPLYDNGCNLLRDFKDKKRAEPYYNNKQSLESFARKSRTCIYKENSTSKYKHFELIERLLEEYPEVTKKAIKKIRKLTKFSLYVILWRLPNEIIEDIHKQYIYKYVIIRKNILLNFLKKEKKQIEKRTMVNLERTK